MLSKQEVDALLLRIKTEVEGKKNVLPEKALRLAMADPEVASYVRGQGGYYYQFLALFIKYFQFKNIVELGNAYGVSTVMINSEMAPDARLTSVDILKDQRYVPEELYQDQHIRFVHGDALDLNIYGGNIPRDIDLFYTDTVHFYRQVKDEYDVYEPLFKDGAFILIDDIFVKDKAKLYNDLSFEKWDISSWCHYNGFGLLRYKREKEFAQPMEIAALRSARIGFRKFYSLKEQLDRQPYRNFYDNARNWAKQHSGPAKLIRSALSPIKKLYTPDDKEL